MLVSGIRGMNVYRSVMFFPYILSTLVVCLIFQAMMSPRNGLINVALKGVGLTSWAQKWLADPKWVWPSIFFVDAWRGVGYVMTIFIAGLLDPLLLLRGGRNRRRELLPAARPHHAADADARDHDQPGLRPDLWPQGI